MTQQAAGQPNEVRAARRRRRWWAFAIPVTILVGVVIVAVVWLLVWPSNLPAVPPVEPSGGTGPSGATGDPSIGVSDTGMLQIQAVRTLLTAAAGIGALFGLVMLARRQQLQEAAHDLDREIASDNRHDAAERRITELYMAAAEQLGHDKAPVRLAALHALDRLGQSDTNHRQVIVDIWCSYLRQPFTPPARFTTTPEEEQDQEPIDTPTDTGTDAADLEYEVRATAQRLLTSHLKDPRKPVNRTNEPPPVKPGGFWALSSIDLTGATLIATDFTDCWLPTATFTHTQFHGNTQFDVAQFHGDARFDVAQFHGDARFDVAQFHGDARFDEAQFHGDAAFSKAQFHGDAAFSKAQFDGDAWCVGAQFRDAWFVEAQFHKDAAFAKAQFHRLTWFSKAQFHQLAWFAEAQFHQLTWFTEAQFHGDAKFDEVVALLSTDETASRVWPRGWTLESDPDGAPGWGRLVEESTASNPNLESLPKRPSYLPSSWPNRPIDPHTNTGQ